MTLLMVAKCLVWFWFVGSITKVVAPRDLVLDRFLVKLD